MMHEQASGKRQHTLGTKEKVTEWSKHSLTHTEHEIEKLEDCNSCNLTFTLKPFLETIIENLRACDFVCGVAKW